MVSCKAPKILLQSISAAEVPDSLPDDNQGGREEQKQQTQCSHPLHPGPRPVGNQQRLKGDRQRRGHRGWPDVAPPRRPPLCFAGANNDVLCPCALPRGAALLTHLFRCCQTAAAAPPAAFSTARHTPYYSVLQFLFQAALEPFLEALSRWIFQGILQVVAGIEEGVLQPTPPT